MNNKVMKTIDYIIKKNFGDVIKHEELAKILEYDIKDVKTFETYKHKMCEIKNELIDYGYILKAVPRYWLLYFET